MGAAPSLPSGKQAKELLAEFQSSCEHAASIVKTADILIVCTGAGFSADSGLATYNDIAKVDAYRERELEYHDICKPGWLEKDIGLFYGFWGMCFNDYRRTGPHKGYEIIAGWKKHKNLTRVAEEMRTILQQEKENQQVKESQQKKERKDGELELKDDDIERLAKLNLQHADTELEQQQEPYLVEKSAGAFFMFTSNVDAHSFDYFEAEEIRECHGNTEVWQCSKPCSNSLWRVPTDFKFEVDTETMLAYERDDDASDVPEQAASTNANTKKKGKKSKSKTKSAKGKKQKGSGEKAVIGDTKGGERVHTLRNMPSQVFKNQATQDALKESFSSNHPKCLYCNEKARPAILMFNDCDWIDSEEQASRWDDWKLGLDKLINSRAYCCWDSKMGHKCDCVQVKTGTVDPVSSNEPVSVCVLEIGAGPNVTTVRMQTEALIKDINRDGGVCTAIRVNPEYPLADEKERDPHIISLYGKGLAALLEMDKHMT